MPSRLLPGLLLVAILLPVSAQATYVVMETYRSYRNSRASLPANIKSGNW
jgi:amino acid permease